MLLQRAAIVVKKLLVDKQQLVSNKYVSTRLYAKFRVEKRCLVKHFSFLEMFAINIEMLSVK